VCSGGKPTEAKVGATGQHGFWERAAVDGACAANAAAH
jgi:hypothetical protein